MKLLLVSLFFILAILYAKSFNVDKQESEEYTLVGDMLLTQDQLMAFQESNELDTRKAKKGKNALWPKAEVPFHITESSRKDRDVIMQAIQHWTDHTCIKFFEIGGAASGALHIQFKKLQGCYSPVGRRWFNNDGQTISIGKNCNTMGIIAHEIGHALGFYHEQNRPDRDKYVIVFEENIKENEGNNFAIYNNIIDYGVPYDINSLMHYAPADFTGNGKNTISPIDPLDEFKIGQREGLSFYDVKLANLMYNCSNLCKNPPECHNGGFVDRLCQCQCPPGTGGLNCDVPVPIPLPPCGGIVREETILTSPDFSDYPVSKSNCVWHIKAPENRRVKAVFEEFDLHRRGEILRTCFYEYLEVRKGDSIYEGDKYCSKELEGTEITSENDFMLLLFKARNGESKGFQVRITFV